MNELMESFIITILNSDGAGYYLCVWQITKNGDVTRYAFQPIETLLPRSPFRRHKAQRHAIDTVA